MSIEREATDNAIRSMTVTLMQFQADAQRRGKPGEFQRYDRMTLDLAAISRAIKAEREAACNE